ncbi:hypothetical protein [Neobacillus sp. PS3-40]|uniref:hypothetical protein n=1 Tax=Neobacillus sp. PS3-40 TaxID=3070679 RepID=UPI0027E0AC2B|nr:hypothetical protein [Neobacillus sp. PS3-40]WML46169.1 hypothetical protein RCG20_09870 [Neobacillus sp. PS3-40]
MLKNENQDTKNEDWVVRFLNLPPTDQMDFLYRFSLDEKLRKAVEKQVFGE